MASSINGNKEAVKGAASLKGERTAQRSSKATRGTPHPGNVALRHDLRRASSEAAPIITVKDLRKTFKVPMKEEKQTFWTGVKDAFYRRWEPREVLKGLDFEIKQGEFVGYVGPNGAGKSTTLKILTGVLTPSSGDVKVAGYTPYLDRYHYTYNIGVVFGQRRLLEFDVPVIESFLLFKDIYELDDKTFKERLEEFNKILKIEKLLHIPVRKLSLGERMRCEIAASLLHRPKVVFLDEPTIGLDPLAKEEIRKFLRTINERDKTTIILTTHDMDDIEETCDRIMIIDEGNLLYDGNLEKLKRRYVTEKTITAEFARIKDAPGFAALKRSGTLLVDESHLLELRVPQKRVEKTVALILRSLELIDLTIKEPRLEDVIKRIYREQQ